MRNAQGKQLALIEPALPAPPPVQRHRDYHINRFRPKTRRDRASPHGADDLSQVLAAAALHPQHDVADLALVRSHPQDPFEGEGFVAASGATFVEIDERTDRAGTARASRMWVFRDRGRARLADERPGGPHVVATNPARRGVDELDGAVPERFHRATERSGWLLGLNHG